MFKIVRIHLIHSDTVRAVALQVILSAYRIDLKDSTCEIIGKVDVAGRRSRVDMQLIAQFVKSKTILVSHA
jgi:hypothetical protein